MRLRIRFTKLGKVRFTSHRDLARVWERALRRAEVPVAYSGGFSPRPRLHFGLALATGAESLGEYLDVDVADGWLGRGDVDVADGWLGHDVDVAEGSLGQLDDVAKLLDEALPVGVDVVALDPIGTGEPSLQECITSCTWSFSFPGLDRERLADAVERALEATSLPVTRQRKGRDVTDDIRPQLHDLRVTQPRPDSRWFGVEAAGAPGTVLLAELGTQPRTVRPAELVAVLDPTSSWPEPRVLRISQWIAHDGGRREPLAAPPPSWACAEVHAS